ncbi:MAG: preprotein translocase subunit SecY, partial [Nanoarchaeota archaeon]
MDYTQILKFFPEVEKPTEKLSFKTKLIWTGLILVVFFILSYIPLLGLGQNSLQQFEQLSIILGASFGSIISLGIGPIVTASIVLQLVVGSGMLNIDTTTPVGRQKFSALQKIATIFFIIFESAAYVFAGGLAPNANLAGTSQYFIMQLALIGQLFLGGYLIVLMDEVTTKWGFGSGVSLFIAAGVASQVFIRAFNPLASPTNPDVPIGAIPFLVKALGGGDVTGAMISAAAIITTVAVFVVAVYAQAMRVEIPLSFGRVRGFGMRWPLKFIYTSNIPVILIAALMANIQLWARLLQNSGHPWLGTFA